MSTLNVNNINEAGGVDAVITAGVLDSGSLPAGSILQVVRATDTTDRTTTSATYVDANISVTITPTTTTSRIIVIWSHQQSPRDGTSNIQRTRLLDSSDVVLSGGEGALAGASGSDTFYNPTTIVAYVEPGTTVAQTYRGQFQRDNAGTTARIQNASRTGTLFAIEVAA